MKSYKLVNSQKVIDKAIRLGYSFDNHPNPCDKEMIILNGIEKNYFFRRINSYNECHDDFKEITQKEFLSLLEPLKVGDWVKTDDSRGVMIAKITWISEDGEQLETFDNNNWCIEPIQCTKLTDNQIEVLEL